MNQHLMFDFSVDKGNNTITVKREFAAPLPLVWDAYTKSELLDQWWAPKPWIARTKNMDFRAGGHWSYAMVSPDGQEHWALLQYHDVNALEGYTATDAFTDPEGNVNAAMPQARWETTFSAAGDKTLVEFRVTYPSLEQLEMVIQMGVKEGLTMAQEGLDALLLTLQA